MTHKEMSEIFAVMLLAYPNAEVFKGGVAKLGPTINLWVTALPEVDYWTGCQAVAKLVRECKYPPTIAEFKTKADAVQSEVMTQISSAWNWVKTEIGVFGESPHEFFVGLPEDSGIRRAIEMIGGPDCIVIKEEHTFGDGHKEMVEEYNYRKFVEAYEKVLRQTNALSGGPRKAVGSGVKQIGGKT